MSATTAAEFERRRLDQKPSWTARDFFITPQATRCCGCGKEQEF